MEWVPLSKSLDHDQLPADYLVSQKLLEVLRLSLIHICLPGDPQVGAHTQVDDVLGVVELEIPLPLPAAAQGLSLIHI